MTAVSGLGQQAGSLARGDIGAVELLETTLERIEDSQPTLNAFRLLCPEAARAEAIEAERRLAGGERLPLLGVPIAVKDDMDLAGEPTSFGCEGEFKPCEEDCEVVRRLRAAGAVIVGKTNTPEIGQWPFTEGLAFGATRNPWSLDHSPGGSSGGSAAAVAAGLLPAAVGSDGAGSIRIPAAWTGLVGLKPQRGRVSTWPAGLAPGVSIMPRSMVGVREWTRRAPDRDRLDPRTRHAARLGLAFRPLLGVARLAERLAQRRVGGVLDHFDAILAPTTAQPPLPIGACDGLSSWETDKRIVAACPYAWPWNVLGWPGLNVPAGFTPDGLPLGAQLLGPANSEGLLLSLGAQLEAERRWHEYRPPRASTPSPGSDS